MLSSVDLPNESGLEDDRMLQAQAVVYKSVFKQNDN